jgi:hypothetical protein
MCEIQMSVSSAVDSSEQQNKSEQHSTKIVEENNDNDNDGLVLVKYLYGLSTLVTWPSVLLTLVSEYCRDIPPICYIFGGVNSNKSLSTCGRIIDAKWSDLPRPLRQARYQCGSCRIGDYIYVTGGIYSDDNHGIRILNTVERLHLPTLQWSEMTSSPLPVPRYDHGCVADDDNLYCIGGCPLETGNFMYRYESKSGVWTVAQSMKFARSYASYIRLNKCIYVFGGSSVDRKSCEMFDINANRWSDIAPMLSDRRGATAVVIDSDKILLLGGEIHGIPVDTVDAYCPISNSWQRLNWTLPGSRNSFASWYDSARKALYIAFGSATLLCNNIYMRSPLDTGDWTLVANCLGRCAFGWTIVA